MRRGYRGKQGDLAQLRDQGPRGRAATHQPSDAKRRCRAASVNKGSANYATAKQCTQNIFQRIVVVFT